MPLVKGHHALFTQKNPTKKVENLMAYSHQETQKRVLWIFGMFIHSKLTKLFWSWSIKETVISKIHHHNKKSEHSSTSLSVSLIIIVNLFMSLLFFSLDRGMISWNGAIESAYRPRFNYLNSTFSRACSFVARP